MDPRTINFNVLRRHDPQISSILDSTSYAVIYRYFHGAWSKTGFEGTLSSSNVIYTPSVAYSFSIDKVSITYAKVCCPDGMSTWMRLDHLEERHLRYLGLRGKGPNENRYCHAGRTPRLLNRKSSASTTTTTSLIFTSSGLALPSGTTSTDHHCRPNYLTRSTLWRRLSLFGTPATDISLASSGRIGYRSRRREGELVTSQSTPNFDPSTLESGLYRRRRRFKLQTPSQNNSNHHQQSQSTHNRRDRRQSSGTENSKQQPSGTTAIEQSSRGMSNQNHPPTRTDHRSLNQHHPHSRRSSGGSSAHSRNGKSHIGLQNPTTATSTQSHQHTHPQHTSNPVNIVPAPVPIENANAEARHNILSLLGHPAAAAATRLDEVFATGTQNPTLVGLPAGNTMWPNPSPDSRGGSNPRNLYSPQQHPSKLSQQGSVPTSHQAYSSPRSHVASQEASPHHNSQHTSTSQHALPISSYGNSADRTPPRNAQISSVNHSPNGPRPQLDSHHHHHHQQQSGTNNLIPGVQSHSNGAPAAPGFSTSVWPFDNKMPNRALSPLNPARQSPSNMAHRGRGYPQPNHNGNNNRKSYQQQPSSRHLPIDHSPPLVNDSSRPSRSHSYTNETNNPANDHSHQRDHPHHQRTSTTNHSPSGHPSTVVNSKLAVESLDHLLIDQKLDGNRSQIANPSVADDQSENPLDKTHFVNSILDLINNNGAFVDTLYARYLARYAEKYL
ncbi:hypothetical protein PSTT_06152 [Puccinia striiformis]|uniref:Uncharacterized protein n=1 Tax=Puccinia striiformis TaxID=27350 RepID=A0A2S4VLB0_9BASI|nr:hypothetical protein PSTT_06152 [Puccinia striiformis]